jgi:hypothetical protein
MLTYKQAAVDQALCFFDKGRSGRARTQPPKTNIRSHKESSWMIHLWENCLTKYLQEYKKNVSRRELCNTGGFKQHSQGASQEKFI